MGMHKLWLHLPFTERQSRDGFHPACYLERNLKDINPDLNQFLLFVDVVLLQLLRLRSSSAHWWPERNI